MNTKIYKCFIASPGDTKSEREICDKVFAEINNSIGSEFDFRIESLKWENSTIPAFGESSQGVINEQIGNDYDLFIGIMYKKFGTPTKNAGSGTEEEFNLAYDRLKNGEKLQIMFYFNNKPASMNEINHEELAKVSDFKKKIESLNGYYFNYDGEKDFEDKLRCHLNKYFSSLHRKSEHDVSDPTLAILESRLNESLCTFSDQPIIWIDPIISNTNTISVDPNDNYSKRIDYNNLIDTPQTSIIKSPPQFGLTCLAHFLVKQAWLKGHTWLYLDASAIKAKPHRIDKFIKKETETLLLNNRKIECIILDEWNNYEQAYYKVLKELINVCGDIPILVMQTIDDSRFFIEQPDETIDIRFNIYHLLALPQNQIRKVVADYNRAKDIGDEDKVLTKVISDLDSLNIHRTPMNCVTLLKVAEGHFDESPVNRTQMLEMVLFALFNMGHLPTYDTKPDLKDCEYVLGLFCEELIRGDKYCFTKEEFIENAEKTCQDQYIDLKISAVFDILLANSIITYRNGEYAFRSSFWIYYFGAKRMHSSPDFAKYIFESKKYIVFPEIIEFYTGIDRSRTDAIEILCKDIEEICDSVRTKVNLPESMNPYNLIKWHPTEDQILKAQKEIGDNVMSSSLPEELKDQHADRSYNQLKPYDQHIYSFMENYSVHNLMQNIKASSRALRNSDYVKPEYKKAILTQILKAWEQISNVLLAISPVLAARGEATFEGAGFFLADNFGSTFEERIRSIIQVVPTNVVGFFKDDIASARIGPLVYEQLSQEENSLTKHELALLLVFTRPRGWKERIEEYIVSLPKSSYYLFDIVNALKAKYKYDFASDADIRDLGYLFKMGLAKHEFGEKKPGLDKIIKMNYALPSRNNND